MSDKATRQEAYGLSPKVIILGIKCGQVGDSLGREKTPDPKVGGVTGIIQLPPNK